MSTKNVLTYMEKYQAQLEKDNKAGKKWIYSNSGCNKTFSYAVKTGNRKANCATIANWALRALKVTSSGQYFYGKSDGTIACSVETMKAIKLKCKVIHVNGKKTAKQAIEDGTLKAGDIVTYQRMQHTNVYGGGDIWYDAGRGNTKDCADGSPFLRWKCTRKNVNDKIAYIIRYIVPTKTIYRVQVSAVKTKLAADRQAIRCFKRTGFPSFYELMPDGLYHVFCGSYEVLTNAQERVYAIAKWYPTAFVKTVEVQV